MMGNNLGWSWGSHSAPPVNKKVPSHSAATAEKITPPRHAEVIPPTAKMASSPSTALVAKNRVDLAQTITTEYPSLLEIQRDGIYFKDGGTPHSLRELMTHIRENWKGRAALRCYENGVEGASRTFRIAVMAYADAYGIAMRDQHEEYKYLALTKAERRWKRYLVGEIRKYHDDTPPSPFAVKNQHIFWKAGVLVGLFYLGWGFMVPLAYMAKGIQWAFVPENFKLICCVLFFGIGGIWLHQAFSDGLFVNQFGPPLPPESSHAQSRKKLGGVYGSANAAEDYEIDQALRGNIGGFAPIFQE